MMLPGLISLAFYRRRPRLGQVVLGLVPTVALSAVLGYPFAGNPLSHGGPIVGPLAAAVTGAILYLAGVAYFYYRYRQRTPEPTGSAPQFVPPLELPIGNYSEPVLSAIGRTSGEEVRPRAPVPSMTEIV